MIVTLCHASLIAGFSLLWLGLLVHAALHAYVMTWGDLYAMFRRVRARVLRPGRVVLRRFRQRQRQHIGPVCRALFAPKWSPAPNPVARATVEPSDDAPRVTGSSAATGTAGPAVPIPPQRGRGAAGSASTSVLAAGGAPSQGQPAREGNESDPPTCDGVQAPAGRDGRTLLPGAANPGGSSAAATHVNEGCVAAAPQCTGSDAR
jgi:hypothetical protein